MRMRAHAEQRKENERDKTQAKEAISKEDR